MGAGSEPQILLIEDDTDVRNTLADLLHQAGYLVATVEDGRQAMQYLRDHRPPRLMILDLLMPFMDGFEFRRETLAEPSLAAIPVIVTTALSAEYRRENVLQATDYFTKPLDVKRLLESIRRCCGA